MPSPFHPYAQRDRHTAAPTRKGAPIERPWRDEVANASSMNLLIGVWLIASPWILGFHGDDPLWSVVIAGALVSWLAFLRLAGGHRQTWLSVMNIVIGAWVLASAFWLYDTDTAAWNSVIAGLLVIVFGLLSVEASVGRRITVKRAR